MFSGSVKSKEEIWNDVKRLIDYGTEEELQRAIREATEQRKASVDKENRIRKAEEAKVDTTLQKSKKKQVTTRKGILK